MTARYLVRLDDACHTMNRKKWGLVEQILDFYGIKPIVAVVPDVRDPQLIVDEPDSAFWNKVRAWQAKGWTVAMHGHTHVMHPTDSKLLLPYYQRSEFAGLTLEDQSAKIAASWRIFLAEGVTPEAWVAPAHSFDLVTLQAVRAQTTIRVVCDGIARNAYYEHGFYWIPQQLWGLVNRRTGLWTVCLHPNSMTDASIAEFGKAIRDRFRDRIVGLQDVPLQTRPKSLASRLYNEIYWLRWRIRNHAPRSSVNE